jgi:hypothetical protein
MMAKYHKATHEIVDRRMVGKRKAAMIGMGYSIPKYLTFCETLLDAGYEIELYEARQTASKYITVRQGGKSFMVRFSNHKPILAREVRGDCDFFVGVTNLGVTTTDDALRAVYDFFGVA